MLGPTLATSAYLLGSISFGLVIARRQGVDLRVLGSGNVGATNAARVLGRKTGRLVLALDAAKGALPALCARAMLGADDPWTAATGAAAVLGHCYPVWHRLSGGKGAATAAGVMLALVPEAGIAGALTYGVLKKVTRRASVGSIAGALAGAGVAWLVVGNSPRAWMGTAIFALVLARHNDNVVRLLRGTEPPS